MLMLIRLKFDFGVVQRLIGNRLDPVGKKKIKIIEEHIS